MQIDADNPRSAFPRWAGVFERSLFPVSAIQRLRVLKREYGREVKTFAAHDPNAFAEMKATA
jgi:hypothetical protein